MESERIKQILQQLVTNPHDEEVMQRLVPLLEQDPKKVLHYAKDVAKQQEGVTHTRLTDVQSEIRWGTKPTTWANCIGEQVCTPIEQREPKSLQDVVDFVNDARAKNQRVRAIGSGHAFSDITRTDNAILVNPHLMNGVLNLNSQTLKEKGKSMKLFRVQSGITVEHLDDELEKAGLALINMGAYDGQTISGALSTGTHGSGATFGPMADFLQSVVLVAESDTVYQIEPTDGITDPAKFSGKLPESDVLVVLKQDDNWFHSVQVAMGCLGVNLLQEMKNEMCGKDRSIRIHWGLDLDLATEKDVRDWYPDFDKWLAVYKQLNTTGMFNNKFTGRIGISI